jgi:Trk K+ transport system NAD-binding subunit
MRRQSQAHHEPSGSPLDSATMTVTPLPEPVSVANDGLPHIIVSGLDNLGRRTIEELRLGDEPVMAIAGNDDEGEGLGRSDVQVVVGDHRRERVLRAAGVTEASSLVLTRDDDLGNLHAALLARELNPAIRLVIRVFDAQIAERLPDLIDNAVALSSSALAAPGFVAAALDGEGGEQFTMAGREFVVRLATDEDAPDAAPHDHLDRRTVAHIDADRSVELLPRPASTHDGTAVLLEAHDPTTLARLEQRDERSSVQRLRDRLASPDRRLVRLGATLVFLALLSAVLFEVTVGLTPVDALSWAIGLLTGSGTGFASVDEASAPGILKAYGILLSLIGAALVGVVYALITDAIIGARLLATLGRRPIPASIRDHVIVCGLGSIGYRVALGVREHGVRVVVVEPDENGRFVAAARALGIPVVAGDARQAEVLRRVGVERCRAICAVTSDDLVNLTAALNARAIRPDLRVVLRLFDPELALRAQHGLAIRFTRSVSHLAAPAFAAAAIGSQVEASVPVGDKRVLLFARVRAAEGSPLARLPISTLDEPGAAAVIGVATDGAPANWAPDPTRLVGSDSDVLVAASRSGLAHLLELSRYHGPD